MDRKIVRAVDVGFGFTKYTTNDGLIGGEISAESFPSIALPVSGQGQQFGPNSKRTTRIALGKNNTFEVGEGVTSLMGSNFARELDLKYPESLSYMALTLGAIDFMDVNYVDWLVVGLPVMNFEFMAPPLRDRLRRVHTLSTGKVEIKDVMVVPQPVGGMYDYGVRNEKIRQMHDQNILIIDPGYFTLDWVVTKEMTVNWSRSGALADAGMAAILRETFSQITNYVQKSVRVTDPSESDLIRLDDAIRQGKEYVLHGKSISVDLFTNARADVITPALRKLQTKVGRFSDIDAIVVVGGGAPLCKDVINAFFEGHRVFVAKDPAFSNARGFQMLGNLRAGLLNDSADVFEKPVTT